MRWLQLCVCAFLRGMFGAWGRDLARSIERGL